MVFLMGSPAMLSGTSAAPSRAPSSESAVGGEQAAFGCARTG
eukprot:CAMPEP_0183540754 /NCGR_PEP_ID=MMETSP0371-20130417/36156_1 /TAXON_ID=268820 /ORGANISM="Peridinium aciculiferum, Strain PAER-2" /LENGTH=41 /DNA_ID= /DNA_START= /DNA_END= /DNA_ORIENTATION=